MIVLLGYIEAKNYYDYVRKTIFNKHEQKLVTRRTVCKINSTKRKKDYYVLFDIKNSQNAHVYYFINPSSGEYNKTTDIVEYMSSNNFQFMRDCPGELELGEK